jgi:Fe-S-cluster containining protein
MDYDMGDMKRIPIFVDEISLLEEYALKNEIEIKFLEDVIFPDIKNEKILVITYKIVLDGNQKSCPVYNGEKGCLVEDIKPSACNAYPIAQKTKDAFNHQVDIDPYCKFVELNESNLSALTFNQVKKIFPIEYMNSRKLMNKNKEIILKINHLTKKQCINIPNTINPEKFNKALQSWEREYLSDFDNE